MLFNITRHLYVSDIIVKTVRSYVAPSSMLSVYIYDKICLKFASYHFLLYAVYIC